MKHEPIFFKRACLEPSLLEFMDIVKQHVDKKGVTVSFRVGQETRAALQNRLAQTWKGEIAAWAHVDDFDFQWGEMKLQHLYPLKAVMPDFMDEAVEEYELTQELAKALRKRVMFAPMTDYERLCRAADICIRSSTIPTMLFARWLDRLQRHYEPHGLVLEAKGNNERAMPTAAERKRLNEAA